MALSDLVVKQAKPTGKAYTLPDIDGLSLAVTPAGGKSWHFRYYWLGKQKRMSLGNYPEVSLREARTLRDEARALVAKDINPHRHRKQKRAAAKLAGEHTFDAVYKKWLAHRELSLKKGRQTTLSILPRVFAKDVLPALGKRSIYDIKRPDLLEVIAKIEKRKALSVAEKVRTWFNQLFRYALVIVPDLEQNPASDLDVVALPLPPVNHNPLRMPPATGHVTGETRKGGDAVNALFDQMPEDTVMCLTVVATPQDVLEGHLNHLSKKSVGETLASEQTRRDVQEARGLIGSAHKLYRGALAFYLRGRDLAQLDARGLQLVNVMLNAGLQPVREEDEVAPLNSYLRWLPCVFDPATDKRQW